MPGCDCNWLHYYLVNIWLELYLYPLTHTFFKVNAYYGAESCWHNTSLKCLRRLCQPIKLHLHNFEAPLEKPFHSRLKSSGMCTGPVNYSCLCNYINLAVTEFLSFPCGVIGIKESKEARGVWQTESGSWLLNEKPISAGIFIYCHVIHQSSFSTQVVFQLPHRLSHSDCAYISLKSSCRSSQACDICRATFLKATMPFSILMCL